MNVELGLRPRYFFSGNICLEISVFWLCSAWPYTLTGYFLHCNENQVYVFLFWELCLWLCHVSVSDLYIPKIGPHISCSRIGRSIATYMYSMPIANTDPNVIHFLSISTYFCTFLIVNVRMYLIMINLCICFHYKIYLCPPTHSLYSKLGNFM